METLNIYGKKIKVTLIIVYVLYIQYFNGENCINYQTCRNNNEYHELKKYFINSL